MLIVGSAPEAKQKYNLRGGRALQSKPDCCDSASACIDLGRVVNVKVVSVGLKGSLLGKGWARFRMVSVTGKFKIKSRFSRCHLT